MYWSLLWCAICVIYQMQAGVLIKALIQASFDGNLVEVRRLVEEEGIDLDFIDSVSGKTPLLIAASQNDQPLVLYLLAQGASVQVADDKEKTPLHYAAQAMPVSILADIIIRGGSLRAQDDHNRTPLFYALLGQNIPAVQFFLSSAPDVLYHSDMYGLFPLHIAVLTQNVELVRLLISQGARVDVQSRQLETPLHLAARGNNKEVVAALLSQKPSVDRKSVV